MSIFAVTLLRIILLVTLNAVVIKCGVNPTGLHDNEATTCEEFSRFARFNPYSVLGSEWMVFYYWGPPQTTMFAKFTVPTVKQKAYLKYILEGHVLDQIDWSARSLLMVERDNRTYFIVEKNDRGHYYLYEPYRGLKEGDIIDRVDIRIKQTGDNLYFGIMACEAKEVFMFARVNEVPKKNEVQAAATRLGYRGRGGRSYLYQGHQWMPIPEADDWHFEEAMKHRDGAPMNVQFSYIPESWGGEVGFCESVLSKNPCDGRHYANGEAAGSLSHARPLPLVTLLTNILCR